MDFMIRLSENLLLVGDINKSYETNSDKMELAESFLSDARTIKEFFLEDPEGYLLDIYDEEEISMSVIRKKKVKDIDFYKLVMFHYLKDMDNFISDSEKRDLSISKFIEVIFSERVNDLNHAYEIYSKYSKQDLNEFTYIIRENMNTGSDLHLNKFFNKKWILKNIDIELGHTFPSKRYGTTHRYIGDYVCSIGDDWGIDYKYLAV